MRKIKFRGRDFAGLWHYGDLVHDNMIVSRCGLNVHVQEETVGQFTGKTDKNGKEIYEGDLFRVKTFFDILVDDNDDRGDKAETGHAIYKTVYNEERMEFQYVLASYTNIEPRCKTLAYWTGNGRPVIGNIHDNPELLK